MVGSRRLSRWRWCGLTTRDWRLLVAVTVAQVVAAAALHTMRLPALRASASRFRRLAQFLVRGSDERIVWAIEATGRRLGRLSTCLIRALVAELVLDSNGGLVSLTIGVRRTSAGTFEAHAWLAREDHVLIGARTDEYVPLVTWTGVPT
jgi:transglutaminase superfamily protein